MTNQRISMTATIICGFPGVGKSYWKENCNGLKIADSDSSNFSKLPGFPENYIEFIKSSMEDFDVILVSTHKPTRECLKKHGIPFGLVYPKNTELNKIEYIERFFKRGSPPAFLELVASNWDVWLKDLEEEECAFRRPLDKGETLSTVAIYVESKDNVKS
jgi:hypothetical protein